MAEESLQEGAEWEELLTRASQWATATLARVSRWAGTLPVIPLCTGLSFVASTAFAYLVMPPDFFRFLLSPSWYLIPGVCLILGFGLGFPLHRAVMRIGDKDRPKTDNWVVVGVGLAWIAAGLMQIYLYDLWTV